MVLQIVENYSPEMQRYLILKTMKKECMHEESQKLVYRVITETMKQFNYEHVGGIPFLGVNGMSLVGHGSSSPVAISIMFHNAVNCIVKKINRKIVASLNQ